MSQEVSDSTSKSPPEFAIPKEPVCSANSKSTVTTPPAPLLSTEQFGDKRPPSDSPPPAANAYHPPDWALPCPSDSGYRLDVIKNGIPLPECSILLSGAPAAGQEVEGAPMDLSFCLIGRQPQPSYASSEDLVGQCAVLAHPSISRLHAVLQFGKPPSHIARTCAVLSDKPGWYIEDLDSTHGTFINKRRLPPGRFVRLHVGHVIRFGGSTRLHLVHGPDDDSEQESEQSWTELKEAHSRRKQLAAAASNRSPASKADLGCDWGMAGDGPNMEGLNLLKLTGSSGACLSHENLYQNDPKRALNAYFEREGIDPAPEYEFSDASFGKQHCKIELPLDTGTVVAEVTVTGKRKEAMAACALEACHLLDRLGEFDPNKDHPSASEYVRRKAYLESNDYYSSDEDTFTDRTGQVERKRLRRIRQMCEDQSVVEQAEREASETIDDNSEDDILSKLKHTMSDSTSLLTVLTKLEELGKEIIQLEERVEEINKDFVPLGANPTELDELEAYMHALKDGAPKRKERSQLKSKLFKLRQLEMQLFQFAGLRQPRRMNNKLSEVDNMVESEIVCKSADSKLRLDAAAAVRAAKHKLESQSDQKDEHFESRLKNTKLIRDEIKRTLPGHKESPLAPQTTECEAFEADEDEEVECEDHSLRPAASNHIVQMPIETMNTGGGSLPGDYPKSKRTVQSASPESIKHIQRDETVLRAQFSEMVDSVPTHTIPEPISIQCMEKNEPVLPAQPQVQVSKIATSKKIPKVDPYKSSDPDYVTWVPPSDQQGDGITSLNAKYGY